MPYNTTDLRRKDRALTESDAGAMLAGSTHGVLCLQHPGGGGYGVPLNYVWDGADCLYMHCAGDGLKLRCLQANPQVSFVILGEATILPAQFSTEYESIVVQGTMEIVADTSEKRRALELLIRRLTPGEITRGMQYIDRALAATTVLRLRIREFCGKAHIISR